MNIYLRLYYYFLARNSSKILSIQTYFLLLLMLLPTNPLKLLFLILQVTTTYLCMRDFERSFLIDAIRNHSTPVNMEEVRDSDLSEKWRAYSLLTALFLTAIGAILTNEVTMLIGL